MDPRVEKRGGQVIDFLLHLQPTAELIPAATGDHGFAEASDCRKPEVFPLGLPANGLEGDEAGDGSAQDEHVAKASASHTTAVDSLTERFALAAIEGGPVDVPLGKIARVARLAWMCHPYTQPALRISCPTEPAEIVDVEGVVVRRQGRELHIGFDNTGQPAGAQDAMVAVAKQLRELPDGCLIDLDTARLGNPVGARPAGLLRFRGTVAAATWRIDATFPPVDAERLREALSVAEALEAPRRFVARDEAEAERIEKRVLQHAADFFVSNRLGRTGPELTLQRRDPAALWQIAVRAFWLRYAGVFPLQDFDEHP